MGIGLKVPGTLPPLWLPQAPSSSPTPRVFAPVLWGQTPARWFLTPERPICGVHRVSSALSIVLDAAHPCRPISSTKLSWRWPPALAGDWSFALSTVLDPLTLRCPPLAGSLASACQPASSPKAETNRSALERLAFYTFNIYSPFPCSERVNSDDSPSRWIPFTSRENLKKGLT